MTNKTSILILFLFLSVSAIQAQSYLRRPWYGDFVGGITLASMDMEGNNQYKKNKIGFMLGANINYKVYHNFLFQSGIYLTKKGLLQHEDRWRQHESGYMEYRDIKTTVDANYVQIPLNIGVEVPIGKDWSFNVNAGVFGAYGFKGDRKRRGYYTSADQMTMINQDQATTSTFSNTSLKVWDYGLGGSVGVVYDIYLLRLQYDHGLANVATMAVGQKWRTRSYSICLGFRL